MLRIALLVLAFGAAAFWAWRRWRPHPLLRVSGRLSRLSRQHRHIKRAVEMRTAMVKLALHSAAADAQPLALDVDGLIESIVAMCQAQVALRTQADELEPLSDHARKLRNEVSDIDRTVRAALDQLHELHVSLVKAAAVELDAAIHEVRESLSDRQRDLQFVVEANREVERLVRRPDEPTDSSENH